MKWESALICHKFPENPIKPTQIESAIIDVIGLHAAYATLSNPFDISTEELVPHHTQMIIMSGFYLRKLLRYRDNQTESN